jgi:hypothetical protein
MISKPSAWETKAGIEAIRNKDTNKGELFTVTLQINSSSDNNKGQTMKAYKKLYHIKLRSQFLEISINYWTVTKEEKIEDTGKNRLL